MTDRQKLFDALKSLELSNEQKYEIADAILNVVKGNDDGGLITFTINSSAGVYSYQAEKGMTWYEWCNSEYNTSYIDDSYSEWYCQHEDSYIYGNYEDIGWGSSKEDHILKSDDVIAKGFDIIENKEYNVRVDSQGLGGE